MKTIIIDALGWSCADDLFDALLPKLGAPAWHGRNLNALDDSLYGGINEVEPPFKVIVINSSAVPPEVRDFITEVAEVFERARRKYDENVSIEVR